MLSLTLAAFLLASSHSASERPIGDPASAIENAQLREFERVALEWLALVDDASANGDWEPSFAAAGQSFQEPNTVKGWREASELARVPLGAVRKRDTTTAEFVNAPPHGYVVMVFETDFEGRAGAVERVTLEREETGWKAVAYVID